LHFFLRSSAPVPDANGFLLCRHPSAQLYPFAQSAVCVDSGGLAEQGEFRRSIDLPAGLDTEKVEAEAKHGSLYITIPKKPEARINHP